MYPPHVASAILIALHSAVQPIVQAVQNIWISPARRAGRSSRMEPTENGGRMLDGERVISPGLIEDLPAVVNTVLEDFVATLVQAAGSQLAAVILFGSAAEGRL